MAGNTTMKTTLTMIKLGSETADTIVANLTSIGEVAGTREEIDVTTLDSPDGAKEFISGAVDFGSFDIAGNITDGIQVEQLYSVFNGKEVRDWEIETPAHNKLAVKGFLQGFAFVEKTVEGLDTFKATVRISGQPVFTAAGTATN